MSVKVTCLSQMLTHDDQVDLEQVSGIPSCVSSMEDLLKTSIL
jgi:hypothetical protein